MRSFSSSVSPDQDNASITSSGVIMPRSPWLASAECTKNAGVPVEASVAAIFLPTWPDLPMPVTITRPRALRIVSTAATKGAPSPSHMAAASAATPSRSVSSVRSAEAMCGLAAGCETPESGALVFARVANEPLPVHEPYVRPTIAIIALTCCAHLLQSLGPRREGVGKGAVAGRALFHRHDGAAAIGIDDGNVEPFLILEQLHIALPVGIDRGQADQEESIGDFDREPRKRRAARLLGLLHQDARHVGDAAAGKIGRQVEHDLDGVACRQRLVGIAAQRPGYGHPPIRDFNVGAHGEFRRQPRAGRNSLGAPDRRADKTFALRVVRILFVEHNPLRHRRCRLIARRAAIGRLSGRLLLRHAAGKFWFGRRRRWRRLGRLSRAELRDHAFHVRQLPIDNRRDNTDDARQHDDLDDADIGARRRRVLVLVFRLRRASRAGPRRLRRKRPLLVELEGLFEALRVLWVVVVRAEIIQIELWLVWRRRRIVVARQTGRLRLISIAGIARGLGRAGAGGAEIVDIVYDVAEAPEPFAAER